MNSDYPYFKESFSSSPRTPRPPLLSKLSDKSCSEKKRNERKMSSKWLILFSFVGFDMKFVLFLCGNCVCRQVCVTWWDILYLHVIKQTSTDSMSWTSLLILSSAKCLTWCITSFTVMHIFVWLNITYLYYVHSSSRVTAQVWSVPWWLLQPHHLETDCGHSHAEGPWHLILQPSE